MSTTTIRYTQDSALFRLPPVDEGPIIESILRRPHGDYTAYDIASIIVPTYFDYCLGTGLNPLLVIAQMVHETNNLASWWAGRPRRNPAGIGVNGMRQAAVPVDRAQWAYQPEARLWLHGCSFDTWKEDAIVAHVGRLLAWALTPARRSVIQRQFVNRALLYRPLAAKYHGSVETLKQLGKVHNPSGEGWASPGTTYGRNIAAVAMRLALGR